jgi:gliding motility-associated-like protein
MVYLRNSLMGLFLLISVNVLSQQRIFATVSGGGLYSIDVENCYRHFVGVTGISFGDIAFTSNGLLWGIANGQLFNIDTTNASTTLIGNTGIGAISLVGLNDSILLAEFQTKLYGINTNNASSYLIGEIGYQATGDLVLIDKNLYMVTPFIKIELNSTSTEILNVLPISLTLPNCEGAAIFNDNYISIIGFNGANLIEICQVDGSYEVICPNLNIDGTPGAASISNYSNDTDLVNVFTPNGDGINDFFQPLGELNHINSIIILNRWGNIVRELSYPFTWDGTSKSGMELVEGVYYYILEKNEGCNDQIQKQSMIHLIR